jgi:predicted RNA-binding protein
MLVAGCGVRPLLPSHYMPGSHWLIALSPENFELTREAQFSLLGLRNRHRRKAERMTPGDRVLYYVLQRRVIPAAVTVTSSYFEDREPFWVNTERPDDPFPYRVHTEPSIILDSWEGLDAEAIAPRLSYLKRWAPEHWFLALQGDIHLLSSQDYLLVETEMQRVTTSRLTRQERKPHSATGDSQAAGCDVAPELVESGTSRPAFY